MTKAGGWAVILGVSEGTGAAIARAVCRDPGLDIFGLHRGLHQAEADSLEREISSLGRRAVLMNADAATAECAATSVEALRELAGPRSVRLLVHSITGASLGYFASGEPDQ